LGVEVMVRHDSIQLVCEMIRLALTAMVAIYAG